METQLNLHNAGTSSEITEQIKNGRDDLRFIEVMSCPCGCIGGHGQPLNADPEKIKAQHSCLYKINQNDKGRTSHNNVHVQSLFNEFLGKSLGELSHKLFHTQYTKGEVLL